ncbi:phenylalanine--tRNA ligase subunit beta [Pseudochrobactrum asaccharolyticum]|jgi:phenylalanyl-tRNA synthetase beta chain|uniref:Phenylalanine--tRNA ligase beta subunit n=1 Tax=Pseudochrobactrum asaccharolyticum TaxID=354351 RepID=A0A366E5X2_9HYPH|nr:phenylalanine--tRNA ligase subunit beta [Pseudochrobactrum asaccharolyticum]MDR2311334.1 phenylalanine--tRNA ligase subunit beta [Brucellaceae bacterium]RBO97786.1 phenylalanyl-tRNA synthetase beta subunit [Pseudochrobactrum asaccharolyticum]
MKFTLSWLKDHLETEATLEEILEKLTDIGLEVDGVDDRAAFKTFKIAKVLTAVQHPDADKLRVLTVDTGEGQPVQVVCGAPNARAGLVGVLGKPGDYVPGLDVTLSVGKIRGVESFGMMCSERELELSDEHNGIIDLPEDAPVGMSFATYMGIDDPIIEVGLTPNRADCTGVHGIARDLAAAGLGKLKGDVIAPVKGAGATPVKVILDQDDDKPFCNGFSLRLVKGVKNGPSPKWLQQRLTAIGLRPINALVDITNYVTFDYGRPLHVFDAAKVQGNLTVRAAKEGETVLALDQREYKLSDNHYVIADEKGVESIAGIMGGEHSGCDENTTDVLIESALWDARMIARTGRELGIITDARYRFERGVDPEMMESGVELATKLVLDFCGGEPTETETVGYTPYSPRAIAFPVSEVKRLTGLEVAYQDAADILTRLGFAVEGDGKAVLQVKVPSWRGDVEGKADLVEEVMRIHGINQIEPQPLPNMGSVNTKILTTLQIRTRLAKRILATRGMMEAVTYSFISEEQAKAFGGGKPELKLANPIAADMSDMRPSLLPGLLSAAQRNADRGFADLALFEVSGTYEGDKPEDQRRVAGGIRRGTAGVEGAGRFWSGNAQNVGVFDAKADALAVLEACGAPVDRIQVEAGGPSWYHPGRSGTLKLGPKVVLGYFGEFHPDALELLDVSGALCGFEVYIDAIPEPKQKSGATKPALTLSQFQSVKRDFAFVVDSTVEAAAIVRAVNSAEKKLIAGAQVFDIFTGASLGEGKKSVAVEVVLQPLDRTLTEEDLEATAKRIVEAVAKQTGGTLRG